MKPAQLHSAEVKSIDGRITITFDPRVPSCPGVYVVIHREDRRPFYVGESRNLRQRLKTLFRCNPSKNPHPCQSAFEGAYGYFPTPDEFCNSFMVQVLDTSGQKGRLEIEEELQKEHGSNNAAFYSAWKNGTASALNANGAGKEKSEPHVLRITRDMRKTGTWVFSPALAEQLPAKGESVRIIFPNNYRVDGRIGFSKGKYLNQARSALKEFVAKHPKAERLSVELGFEGKTHTITIKL